VLSAADQNALNLLLPILPRGRLMLASEVVALVLVDAHGDLLRHHLADYLQRDTSRAIGKFLRRCCGRPVAGSYIECLGDSGRGGLLYLVREFGA